MNRLCLEYIHTRIGLEWTDELTCEIGDILQFFKGYFIFKKDNKDCNIYISFMPYYRFNDIKFNSFHPSNIVIRKSSAQQFCFDGFTTCNNDIEWVNSPSTKTAFLLHLNDNKIEIYICSSSYFQVIDFIRSLVVNKEEYHGTIVLHAAGLVYKNQGIAIVGTKGSGKTTFSLELLKNKDMKFFSGDKLFLHLSDNGIIIYPWPDFPHVGMGTICNDHVIMDALDKKGYTIEHNLPQKKILLKQYELCEILGIIPHYQPVNLSKILLPVISNKPPIVERVYHKEEYIMNNLELSDENMFSRWTKTLVPCPKQNQLSQISKLHSLLENIPFYSIMGNSHFTQEQREILYA